jgi:hypothetical protein
MQSLFYRLLVGKYAELAWLKAKGTYVIGNTA